MVSPEGGGRNRPSEWARRPPPWSHHLVFCVLGSTEEFNENADPALSFVATQLEWFVFSVVFARLVEWQNEKEATANLAVGPQQ